MKRVLREIAETIILVALIMGAVNTVVDRRHVAGPSMEPTLYEGQALLANKLPYSGPVSRALAFNESEEQHEQRIVPHRGDIVILKRPGNRDATDLVKRVVGLPGETIEIRSGAVYVDGLPLDEPYIVYREAHDLPPTRIPPGRVYVLGDNRANSNDSRNFGPISIDDIVGQAWFRYWPPQNVGLLAHP